MFDMFMQVVNVVPLCHVIRSIGQIYVYDIC